MRDLDSEKDFLAVQKFGAFFIKMPRSVIMRMSGNDEDERLTGRLHLFLICLCYYKDGYVSLNGSKIPCSKGEYIGSKRKLSALTGIAYGSVGRILDRLEKEGLIIIRLIPGGRSIRVCGYTQFVLPEEVNKEAMKAKTPEEAHAEEMRRLRKEKDSESQTEKPFF